MEGWAFRDPDRLPFIKVYLVIFECSEELLSAANLFVARHKENAELLDMRNQENWVHLFKRYVTLINEKGNVIVNRQNTHQSLHVVESISHSFSSPSSRESMIQQLQNLIVRQIASQYSSQVIIYAENATEMAAKMLALTASGRGYSAPWEQAVLTRLSDGIWSSRPLKDLVASEIAYFNRLYGRDNVEDTHGSDSSKTNTTTLNSLTINYFADLEESFPSIVATVGRMSEKLALPLIRNEEKSMCLICAYPFEKGSDQWLNSVSVKTGVNTGNYTVNEGVDNQIINRRMCYGCLVAFRDLHGTTAWPDLECTADKGV